MFHTIWKKWVKLDHVLEFKENFVQSLKPRRIQKHQPSVDSSWHFLNGVSFFGMGNPRLTQLTRKKNSCSTGSTAESAFLHGMAGGRFNKCALISVCHVFASYPTWPHGLAWDLVCQCRPRDFLRYPIKLQESWNILLVISKGRSSYYVLQIFCAFFSHFRSFQTASAKNNRDARGPIVAPQLRTPRISGGVAAKCVRCGSMHSRLLHPLDTSIGRIRCWNLHKKNDTKQKEPPRPWQAHTKIKIGETYTTTSLLH